MDASPLNLFFAALAGRFYKENDLSDVTWAMCEASPAFKRLWIRFFFGDALDPDAVVNIDREVPSDDRGGRVDFYLQTRTGETFLIEVKIGDRNQHFGTYDEAYSIPPERLGYITNYPLKNTGPYRPRRWSELCYELEKADGIPAGERELIQGYLDYLRRVCGIVMLTEKIDIERISALYGLALLIVELCADKTDRYEVSFYDLRDKLDVRWLYFKVKYVDFPDWPAQYPYIGVRFSGDQPAIEGGFDNRNGWARQACQFLSDSKAVVQGIDRTHCAAPWKRYDWHLDLSPETMSAFRAAPTLADQKQLLQSYIRELVQFPLKVLDFVSKEK